MKMLKNILYILLMMMLCVPATAEAQQRKPSTQMTQAQKKKAKAAAKKKKAQEKKAAERKKAADQKQRDREREALKKAGGDKAVLAKTKEAADRLAKKTVYHHIAMWGGLGYSGMVENYNKGNNEYKLGLGDATGEFKNKFLGGGGGLIGAGYELHYKKFIFHTGPEIRLFTSMDRFDFSQPFQQSRLDSWTYLDKNGQPYTDYYGQHMTQSYTPEKMYENQTVGQVMLPIMFGGNFDRYYFLAGAKIGYTFMSLYSQKGNLTTSVKDNWAVDAFEHMSNHALEEAKLTEHSLYAGGNKGNNPFGLDVTLSAEFGVNLNEFFSDTWQAQNEERKHPWHMRVAAFIDYGMPIMSVGREDFGGLYPEGAPIMAFGAGANAGAPMIQSTSVHQSQFASSKVNSLLVGVKFTALLQMNKPKVPNPFICFLVTDTIGRPTKSVAAVEISQPLAPKRKPKLRKMGKDGRLDIRYAKDRYAMIAQAPGYLPSNYAGDTLVMDHINDGDSAIFRLIPVPQLATYVMNEETGKRIPAHIEYISLDNEHYNAQGDATEETAHSVSLHYGDRYLVRVTAPNYHPDSMTIANLTDTITLTMRPIHRLRHKLILNHMYFATDKTEILPMSEGDIMKLYNFLHENPRIRVLITGHTDSDGSEQHNQILSEGRAASLKQEMIKRGIAEDRMETDGKGESEPIDTNATEAGKQNNRRVEVTVLNADEAEEDVW